MAHYSCLNTENYVGLMKGIVARDPYSSSYVNTIAYPSGFSTPQLLTANANCETLNFAYNDGRSNFYPSNVSSIMNPVSGGRCCFVRVPCKAYLRDQRWLTGDTYDRYIILSNKISGSKIFEFSHRYATPMTTQYDSYWADGTMAFRNTQYFCGNTGQTTGSVYNDSVKQAINNTHVPVDSLSVSDTFTEIQTRLIQAQLNLYTLNPYGIGFYGQGCGFSMAMNEIYGATSENYAASFTIWKKFPFPVFELDADAIANYLISGDEGGAIDPFDPQNPSIEEITNYKTNFEAYVSLGDPAQPYRGFTNIHWSIRGYNRQYDDNRGFFEGMYRLSVYSAGYPWIDHKTTRAQVPVASYTQAIANNTGNNNTLQFYFGDSDYDLPIPDGYAGRSSGFFLIHYQYKAGSNVKCKIATVKFNSTPFTADWEHEGTALTPVNIGTDAMKYTASSGETLTIYYRAITIEDLKYTSDDGYHDITDTEQTATGSDTTFTVGSGLNTFNISNAQFDIINKALWSTDWTQVFKSTTIDPVKCVITCKGIKFANAGVGAVPIIIANRDTDVTSGVVNPVKSFSIDNCYIDAVNKDFTDITLMRVHCYLPYIGWVDLPASEVVGRASYRNVQAVSKRLKFKYIVDFVDGACRCIISVNGTERWFFDGNCAIDIPVTSDNHTSAISTAIKSGVATGLSLATGVVGAVSGNVGAVAGGVVGTMNNAPNILPTYEYSASASPSGYINGSCNDHIIVVCEVPNEQIPSGYAHNVGRPCYRYLSLASLVGFTKCKNVNVSNIDATPNELNMIIEALTSGVYL